VRMCWRLAERSCPAGLAGCAAGGHFVIVDTFFLA
jgi:hypothetical protein